MPIYGYDYYAHDKYDLAIIRLKNYTQSLYQGHAVFAKDGNTIRPGDYLCRLGYPFPEFNNYSYNNEIDDIEWTNQGRVTSPIFPIEGMFTRNFIDPTDNDKVYGIEISTPGLRGQSGGPLFNSDGVIYGMQSMTNHLHLGFDMINQTIVIDGKNTSVNNQPFLHVGQCVHVDIIKDFLKKNNIEFFEE